MNKSVLLTPTFQHFVALLLSGQPTLCMDANLVLPREVYRKPMHFRWHTYRRAHAWTAAISVRLSRVAAPRTRHRVAWRKSCAPAACTRTRRPARPLRRLGSPGASQARRESMHNLGPPGWRLWRPAASTSLGGRSYSRLAVAGVVARSDAASGSLSVRLLLFLPPANEIGRASSMLASRTPGPQPAFTAFEGA